MNPTLTNLISDVYTLTNRPDLVGETLLAVKQSTIKAHSSDYYYKDLTESGIQFDFSQTQQVFDYKTIVPRWRALKYVRKYDYSTPPGEPMEFLTILTPDNVLDSYGVNKENVAYVAGLELKIRTLVAWQYFLVGCYIFPDVTADNYSSWIANEMPAAIIYDAAATVFKTIGYDEQAAAYRAMVQEFYAELRLTNIVANGY